MCIRDSCEVIAKIKTLTEFFKDKMSHNEEVINEVDSLMKESIKSGVNKKLMENLVELIQRIPGAIMRWPMALEDVVKQAIKSNQLQVEREARKAYETMRNVCRHIDAYKSDYTNFELVDIKADEMECRQLSTYGLLIYEVEDVGVYFKKQDQKSFPKHKVLHVF